MFVATKRPHISNDSTRRADLSYVREIMRQPLLTRENEFILARAWAEHQDEDSLHQLVTAYSRLVIAIAIRFRHYGLPMGDLIQEGNIGLMEAAERFEPERDIRFSTYAKWWIRSCIQDYILRNWSIVRTGSTAAQKQLFFNLRRLRAQLTNVTSENMSPDERELIARTLHVNIKDVEDMENRISTHDLSLSNPISEDSLEDWVDTLEDTMPNPEELTQDSYDSLVRHHWIQAALRLLPPRERQIIMLRHLSENNLTLEQLGKVLKISKERVRQLESRALRRMQTHLADHFMDIKEIL